eukprot:TRINITY_DN9421_c0_g1_i1.p1 TRINITY_DN9421_c0_g1~~TRINITY_DN9421_c0_g1_i1.p1  ORF type:complete len:447 (-),score=74.59 TRINITY_DN9421_c0_g1_i1:183-1328(-)
MEIYSTDECYEYVYQWLNDHPYTKNTRQITMQSTYIKNREGENVLQQLAVPSYGSHFLRCKGRWCYLTREVDDALNFSIGAHTEKISFTTLGNGIDLFKSIINEAMQMNSEKENGKLVIYTQIGGNWEKMGVRESRPLHSVILEKSVKDKLISDIEEFLYNSRSWYQGLGLPYRRGYLLYGPPGCGKTSIVKAIASEYNMKICIFSLNNPEVKDDTINAILNNLPPKSIVLIEDIDAAMVGSGAVDRSKDSSTLINQAGLTLGGLLNALDGVASQEGNIMFMTTNKPVVLDKALIRGGRVDEYFRIGLANRQQIFEIYLRFYPEQTEEDAQAFANSLEEDEYSMAELQKYLMFLRNQPEKAIHLQHLIKQSNDLEWDAESI